MKTGNNNNEEKISIYIRAHTLTVPYKSKWQLNGENRIESK